MRGQASLWSIALAVMVAGTMLLKYGTLSPCGILREEIRQEALRQGGISTAVTAMLPDAAMDAIVATKYGELTPGKCISILIDYPQSPHADTTRVNYDGQWVADVPVQGSCPAAHMTLFVNGENIVGSVVNSFGTFAVNGKIGVDGHGEIQIRDFKGRVKFSDKSFAADYFNSCGERRAIGKRLAGRNP